MPSFTDSLEKALHKALTYANERAQEYATLEHLLLALIEDEDAAAVMRACNVDLKTLQENLTDYIDTELANLVTGYNEDSKPTGRISARDPACGYSCAILGAGGSNRGKCACGNFC